jgi:hypothetical protein
VYPRPALPTLSGGLLDYNNDVANAVYHGLTLTAVERIGRLFNLTANYTYSHTIDNGNFTTFINLPPNQFNYASERGNSNQDVRHHVVANFTADGPQDSFARNFEFSSIITLQSGRPFTLFAGRKRSWRRGWPEHGPRRRPGRCLHQRVELRHDDRPEHLHWRSSVFL